MEIQWFGFNVHVQRYIHVYCVYHNLTHEHKSTKWRGDGSYVENHHQKVQHSHWEKLKEIVQDPSIIMSPALSAFQGVWVAIVQCAECAFSI